MIHLSFGLSNPFSKRRFDLVYDKAVSLSKNKHIEFNVYRDRCIVSGSIRFTTRADHAGLALDFSLFPWNVEFVFYDSRHWVEAAGTWEVSDET